MKTKESIVFPVAVFAFLLCLWLLAGCDTGGSGPEVTTLSLPDPVDPANFPSDPGPLNPYFPLEVGLTTRIIGLAPEGEEVILVEVTDRKKLIQGVVTTVVRDRVWLDGELIEDTDDWFAQDRSGNVWYFGEDVKNYANGEIVDRHGSWESGVDGAMAGIVMHAVPRVGSIYRQEYYRGHAEDIGEVIALDQTVDVPFGRLEGCVQTEDTTPLEPDVLEYKYFCPGVGNALTVDVSEGNARFELVEVGNPDN